MSEQVTCPLTGLRLVAAAGESGWRVAHERYVRRGGILSVAVNKQVGPLPAGAPDSRGRFDTVGRTVYFGQTEEVAFAEVLQGFRKRAVAVSADAEAAGYADVDQYIAEVLSDARANRMDRPWAISGDWQWARCVHEVAMPTEGWWVVIDHPDTLNTLTNRLAPSLRRLGIDMVTTGLTAGEGREVTTLLAEEVRNTVLFDRSLPLGIDFPSKTAYGRCWAWWDRNADDGLLPGPNDPRTIHDHNVDRPAMRAIAGAWDLPVLQGRPRH